MTAPLTPHDHDQQPPNPPVPDEHGGAPDERPSLGRELRDGGIVAAAVAVCGVLFGLLWVWLAPQVPLISDGSAVYLKNSEGEQAIGADGWFALMGLGFGVLTAAAVFLWRRAGGVAIVVGLAVGAVLGSLIAWRLGVWLGPTQNVVAHAKAVGPNKVFYAPLELRAKGALLAWPVAAMAAFLALTSAFGPREPHPQPHWDGWSAPPPNPHPQGDTTPPPDHPDRPDRPDHP
ncbi:DUF2567 domain-containing protein [Streptantibioticus ferralitis]|uniref:DUF2567 domain-containing protein n=1 Tax=Streptantibioticus ferralitis TaxID=236510 RepID=A0ABT5Z044_9ACTN|nr:DUF2567 domain-containing protein [Streptantibioticus ferralitis]MDF2257042.1 DUF2567 domain-containing protein [Streptantibioticus ferralitis]